MNFTPEQIKQGEESAMYLFRFFHQTGIMPPNFTDFMELPIGIPDETGTVHYKPLGSLTADDLDAWANAHSA